ncbi:DUF6174 domain-containing protein [Pyxidicoccus xibeiensis]|uniref:DUF6174 domain-containing protein n=1 Tax=Pyxidicoccus xibeiensis TaxID=2906759 RepID=UPI0020A7F39B|nr:DUF6174 domain-containing protein [Pyxidicoccus xibeiensis]MCP3142787.1 DUF6174 domain-containing protein [Pyxidicoccus xibeiensis]
MTRSGWSRRAVIRVLTGALIVGAVGCTDGEREQVDSERRAWETVRPSRYRFDYTATGFAPGGGPWRIEVNEQQVVSVTYVGQGAVPTPGFTEATAPTVDVLFERVARALDASSVEVTVRHDPQWHHPVEAHFDRGMEGDGFKAEGLTPVD